MDNVTAAWHYEIMRYQHHLVYCPMCDIEHDNHTECQRGEEISQ